MAFWDLFKFKKKPFKEPFEEEKGKEKTASQKQEPSSEKKAEVVLGGAEEANIILPEFVAGVLLKPHLSEKASLLAEKNKVIFQVHPKATKKQIAEAIHRLYKVRPLKINIVKRQGKIVRYGKTVGRTKGIKKAIVTFAPNQKINIV